MKNNSALKILFTILLIAFVKIAGATTQVVNVQNFSFTPSSFSINLGDTVKWVWVNGTHTTSSLTIPVGAATWNHNMNSSAGNTSFTYVPTVSGTYNFQCNIHPTTMMGSFTVSCPTPSVTISAGGATTFCNGGSVSLSTTGVYTTYQWKNGGTSI